MLKKSLVIISTIGICSSGALAFSQDNYPLDNEEKKYGYAVGTKIGQQLLRQFNQMSSDMDFEAFRMGLNAILSGQTPQLDDAEATDIIQQIQIAQQQQAERMATQRKVQGEQYLEKNKTAEGVVVTDSGLQYKEIESGDADGARPTESDTVVVHYEGTLIDGTIFDSSYARGEPATFPLSGIITGWKEALQLMKPGDKWSVVIPSELAYGERGAGGLIGPNETLVFTIELIAVKTSQN